MDRHGAEPQDEAGLVHEVDRLAQRVGHEEQGDPGCEHEEGEHHHERSEEAQEDGGRAAPAVGAVPPVVLHHPPSGGADLEQHEGHQHHADDHVGGREGPELQDGQPLGGQQHQQDRSGGAGQPGVPGRSTEPRAGPVGGGGRRASTPRRGCRCPLRHPRSVRHQPDDPMTSRTDSGRGPAGTATRVGSDRPCTRDALRVGSSARRMHRRSVRYVVRRTAQVRRCGHRGVTRNSSSSGFPDVGCPPAPRGGRRRGPGGLSLPVQLRQLRRAPSRSPNSLVRGVLTDQSTAGGAPAPSRSAGDR